MARAFGREGIRVNSRESIVGRFIQRAARDLLSLKSETMGNGQEVGVGGNIGL